MNKSKSEQQPKNQLYIYYTMNKETSTTKWGRVYLNEELINKLREIWLNSPVREYKIAPGVAYTVYPNGTVKQGW